MLSLFKNSFLYFRTKKYFWEEEKKVKKIGHPRFQQVDRALLRKYRFVNPYHISRKYLQKKNTFEIHAYGETPITTLLQIVSQCEISSKDTVIEMGAGRGRAAFF